MQQPCRGVATTTTFWWCPICAKFRTRFTRALVSTSKSSFSDKFSKLHSRKPNKCAFSRILQSFICMKIATSVSLARCKPVSARSKPSSPSLTTKIFKSICSPPNAPPLGYAHCAKKTGKNLFFY